MANPVPTLSPAGWLESGVEKLDMLLGYYLTSEANQTTLYYGNITSLPLLVAKYGKDESKLTEEVENSLRVFLERYYDNIEVEVNSQEIKNSPANQYGIAIKIFTTAADGTRSNLATDLAIYDGTFKILAKNNNVGA